MIIPAFEPDPQVVAINSSIGEIFKEHQYGTADKRRFYRLVGAVWLDQPHETFKLDQSFANDATRETSDEGMVAGEDGLSSTAMESFTQNSQTNCFGCHDTKAITRETPTTEVTIMKKNLINVSHILSKFLIETP